MHFTDYVDNIKKLLKEKNYAEAERLLILCIELTEKESKNEGYGVAPWYYERLAILYKKQKRFVDEISILERYDRQLKAGGVKPLKLKERLIKAKKRVLEIL